MDAPIIAPSNFLVLPSLFPLRQCCHRSREMKKAAALAPLLGGLRCPGRRLKNAAWRRRRHGALCDRPSFKGIGCRWLPIRGCEGITNGRHLHGTECGRACNPSLMRRARQTAHRRTILGLRCGVGVGEGSVK